MTPPSLRPGGRAVRAVAVGAARDSPFPWGSDKRVPGNRNDMHVIHVTVR
ncbi:hypothetical protein QFZ58_004974 [Streptomyces sp. B1I3]|nr:hypothetical protein [Streptomyces sp. B1I3]